MSDFIQNDIPEINLVLKSEPVTAVSRKLKVMWSVDPVAELETYHAHNLFEGILEINGKTYINERFKDKYKDWNLPLVRIKCQIKRKLKAFWTPEMELDMLHRCGIKYKRICKIKNKDK